MNKLFADAENKYKEEQKRLENEAKAKAQGTTNQQNTGDNKSQPKPEDKMDVE